MVYRWRRNGNVQSERNNAGRHVHSHRRHRTDNAEVDGFQCAVSERDGGCSDHHHSTADYGNGWRKPDDFSGRHDGAAWRKHSGYRNRHVVDRDSWSNGHVQSECFNAECHVHSPDRQRCHHASMDDLQSAVSVFKRGCDDPGRGRAHHNLSGKSNNGERRA